MSQQLLSRFFSKKETNVKNEAVAEDACQSTPTSKLSTFAFTGTSRANDNSNPKSRKRPASIEPTPNKPKKAKGLTDFEQQVLDLKVNHLDKLLFIQSGYRYKIFGSDAVTASRILNIKLVNGKISFDFKNPSKDDHLYSTFAYASIPIERLLVHVRRLIVKGYKVGVVDQVETKAIRDNSKSKGKVFDRHLSNVYSAGTFINDEDLEKNVNGKSILFLNESSDDTLSVVSINVYITEIAYDQFKDDFTRINLESRLHHLEPIEIIAVGDISSKTERCIKNFVKFNESHTSNINYISSPMSGKSFSDLLVEIEKKFRDDSSTFSFLSSFNQSLLECFNKAFDYLNEFGLTAIFKYLENFKKFSDIDNCTILNSHVLQNLEIFSNLTTNSNDGTLFELINCTMTKFGERMLKSWLQRPLIDKNDINDRHEAIGSLMGKLNGLQIERVKSVLKNCPDLELILSRIHYGRSNRKEVYLFLKKISEILNVFNTMRDELISLDVLNSALLFDLFNYIKELSKSDLVDFNDYLSMINSQHAMDAKSNDHIIRYFNEKFYDYLEIEIENEEISRIEQLFDQELQEIKKITKDRDTQYITVSNEPYLIQIRKSNVKHVPPDWVRISATLNCVRYRTPEMVQLYKKLQYHQDLLKKTCDSLFVDFVTRISNYHIQITKLIRLLAQFDSLLSLTLTSLNYNFSRPLVVDVPIIHIKGSRNPIAEKLLKEKPSIIQSNGSSNQLHKYSLPSTYIENDFQLKGGDPKDSSRIALITGPNMGGKSSFMRQVGLIVILSQIGSFIPCSEGSILGTFANICIRLGSNDDIFAGKSTFQVELLECRNILETCIEKDKDEALNKSGKPGNSLILLDELGRGTSSVDGSSIAWSVLDYLTYEMSDTVLCLFVTHFNELEAFQEKSKGIVKNYHLGYKLLNDANGEETVMFTYKLTPGYSASSFGIYCARIAGLPDNILAKANQISNDFEVTYLRRKITRIANNIKRNDVENLFQLADST